MVHGSFIKKIHRSYAYYLICSFGICNSENFSKSCRIYDVGFRNSVSLRPPVIHTCSIVFRNPKEKKMIYRLSYLLLWMRLKEIPVQVSFLANPAEFIAWGSETARPPVVLQKF
jgi:hypothetical protein